MNLRFAEITLTGECVVLEMGVVGAGKYGMGLNISNVVMPSKFRSFKAQIRFKVWHSGCCHGPKTTIVVNIVVLRLYSEKYMQCLVM